MRFFEEGLVSRQFCLLRRLIEHIFAVLGVVDNAWRGDVGVGGVHHHMRR